MVCKKCQEDKPKIKAEVIPGRIRGHYFRDEDGRLWHGKVCPTCYWPRGVGFCKEETDEEELHYDRFFESDPLTQRKCRKCFKFLPVSKYFRHEECENKDITDLIEW